MAKTLLVSVPTGTESADSAEREDAQDQLRSRGSLDEFLL